MPAPPGSAPYGLDRTVKHRCTSCASRPQALARRGEVSACLTSGLEHHVALVGNAKTTDARLSANPRTSNSIAGRRASNAALVSPEDDRPKEATVTEHQARIGLVAKWTDVAATTADLNLPPAGPWIEKHPHVGWNPIDVAVSRSGFESAPAVRY
jgi:hypothetical protein